MELQYGSLEVTTRIGCPVACTYCPQGKTGQGYVGDRIMSVETLHKCLDKVPVRVNDVGYTYPRIEFSGFSEPYANPNCSDLINLVYDKGFRDITLYTTFRGMKKADFDRIKHIDFTFVSIHLPDSKGMAQIPLHEDYFDLLKSFMETFKVGFFAYGDVRPEVLNFILGIHPDAITGRYKWQVEIHSRAGNLEDVPSRERINGHIKCNAVPNMELNHNILLPNGDVSVCCMDFSRKHIVGNLLTDEYEDLFKSDGHNKLVAGMYLDDMDILCRQCTYAIPNLKN
jgi:hypothetical protein